MYRPAAPPPRPTMIGSPAGSGGEEDDPRAGDAGGGRLQPPGTLSASAPPPWAANRAHEYAPPPGSRPVSWLHGVGYSREYSLGRAGIRTVDDMARVPDAAAAAALSGLPVSFIERAKTKARAAAENRIIQRRRMVVPPDEEMAIFDIETDTTSSAVWLIGVLHRGRVEQFMAEADGGWMSSGAMPGGRRGRGAARMLSEFAAHLEALRSDGCEALVSYSGTGFDRRVTGAAMARHGVGPGAFASMRHIDACSLVRRSFVVPCQSYALKALGSALGYGFSHAGMDGLDAALAFERHAAYGEPIDPAVLEYNRDDVLSVRHIIDSLEAGGFDVERRSEVGGGDGRKAAPSGPRRRRPARGRRTGG